MIYIAVKGHSDCPCSIGKVLFVFLAVAIFILAGFEQCITNAAYYTIAGIFDWNFVFYFFLMIIGNAIGSIFFDGMLKLIAKFKPNKEKEEQQKTGN